MSLILRVPYLKYFDSFKEFRSYSAGPQGNFFAISGPGSNIYNDVAETLPYSSALRTYTNLRNCLVSEREETGQDIVTDLFENFRSCITRMDSKDTYNSRNALLPILKKYIEFRILNWIIGIYLNKTQAAISQDFYLSAGRVIALTNDLYSWAVKRKESLDRMEENNAVAILKGLAWENSGRSRTMTRYIEAMELILGGNCFWSSTCPYYTRHEEEWHSVRNICLTRPKDAAFLKSAK
ncbi:isoprenoid synthase domain-containing protein [Astrocystis sublimbata]|nr:isoprenoid synthase domain-containing protein [Astrocystis sublimbata]